MRKGLIVRNVKNMYSHLESLELINMNQKEAEKKFMQGLIKLPTHKLPNGKEYVLTEDIGKLTDRTIGKINSKPQVSPSGKSDNNDFKKVCHYTGKKGYVEEEDCHCFCCGTHNGKPIPKS